MYRYLRLHVYIYEVTSYDGSYRKWSLLRGARHPGMP